MTLENQKKLLHIVYGEKRDAWPLNELSCAKRLLSLPGMTLDRVGLLMAIASSSRHWESIIISAEKLELHLDKLSDLLAKDPSAPGNRAGEEAYHEKPNTPDQIEFLTRTKKMREESVAAVQKPWLDLIEQARAQGLRGPAVGRWVFAERERLTGKTLPVAKALFGAFVAAAGHELPPSPPPSRRAHVEPQQVGDSRAPKRVEPEEHARAWHDEEDQEGGE